MPASVRIMDYYAARKVKSSEIDDIVDSYMSDPCMVIHVLGDDLVIDVAEAIEASAYARLMLRDASISLSQRRHALWNAVFLAKPYQVPLAAP
jgi:hypothetical protein